MAVSGTSLAITIGIYLAIALVVFILFSRWRDNKFTRKFFAPKCYMAPPRPPKIRGKWAKWVPQVIYMSEAEVIRCAGIDAAVYLKILRLGFELFCIISFWSLVVILPINVTGGQVNKLMSNPNQGTLADNSLVWWVPSPPPPPPGGEGSSGLQSDIPVDNQIAPPKMYNTSIGPAPPGMLWWEYLDSVPPLPTPAEYFCPNGVPNPCPYQNYTWRWNDAYVETKYKFTNLDKITIANISSNSPRLWAHAVIAYIVSFFTYYWLWKYNKEALRLRVFYLLNQPAGAESHTVFVQDVPGVAFGTIPNRADGTLLKVIPKSVKEKAFAQANMLQARTKSAVAKAAATGTGAVVKTDAEALAENAAAAADLSHGAIEVDAKTGRWEMRDDWLVAVNEILDKDGSVSGMVEDEFRKIHGDHLSAVHMCHDTSKLDPLVAEYEKIKTAMTDLVDNYISLKRRGKELKVKQITVIGATMGEWGKERYGMKPKKVEALEFYRDRLTELRRMILEEQEAAKEPMSLYPSAFVTFNNRMSQVIASRTMMSEDLSAWRVQAAPRAEEIIWKNVGWRAWERAGRTLAMGALFWAMTAFFMIPVAAVQGLLSMNSFLSFLNKIPIAGAMIQGILPGLALKIFLALVPMFITMMNRFAGMVSTSQVDLGVVSKYFVFQVITVFMGSFIAGTFFNQLNQFIKDPGSIIKVFGTSAPQTGLFFFTYVLLEALPGASMALLRIVPLIIFWVKTKFLAGTERAKARLWQNQTFTYGVQLPNDMIAFLLCLCFCTICPIIAPLAVIYFGHIYLVSKYNLIYAYNPAYQSGGVMWLKVNNQIIVSLFFFHLVMVAILGVKGGAGPAIFTVLLWIFDAAMLVATHSRFYRPQECLSLISAAEIDKKEVALAAAAAAAAEQYTSPRGGKGGSVDEEVSSRYLSPSFKFSEEEHEAALSEATRMGAVLAGGEDEKLFAEAPEETEADEDSHRDADIEEGREGYDTFISGEAVATGSASQEVKLEVPSTPDDQPALPPSVSASKV